MPVAQFISTFGFNLHVLSVGAIQVLRNAIWGGGQLSRKKALQRCRFNVISVTRGWVGVKFTGKERYVILEWPIKEIV